MNNHKYKDITDSIKNGEVIHFGNIKGFLAWEKPYCDVDEFIPFTLQYPEKSEFGYCQIFFHKDTRFFIDENVSTQTIYAFLINGLFLKINYDTVNNFFTDMFDRKINGSLEEQCNDMFIKSKYTNIIYNTIY